MSLTVDHRFIDAACSDGIVACGMNTCESFIMPQVEIGLHTVDGDVTLTMLVWIQCTRINVDVGVEFLNCNFVATGL